MDISSPATENSITEDEIFGERVGLFARVFGCRHYRMSRPVTTDSITYQYCSECGIRRKYDAVTFKPAKELYYPASAEMAQHV